MVEVKEVGGKKQLIFQGGLKSAGEATPAGAAPAAGSGGTT